jgi:FKBP-type peptidyl-prolyl cis-trans isomerase FkpA
VHNASWLTLLLGLVSACHATVPPAATAPLLNVPDANRSAGGADPLCGEHYRWDGTRCVELPATEAPKPSNEPAALGIEVEELAEGSGKPAASGDTVRVNYKGMLADGTVFDSSSGREPFEFKLGSNMVVKGFDRAVQGMKAGGKRRVRIPPNLAYGARGSPPRIPPNATLVFEIELVEIE